MKLSLDINTDYEVTTLSDLPKLKIVMESLNMKINKSEIARQMNVDRRTVEKYLNGFKPSVNRKKQSKIDPYYDLIKDLLSEECEQKFFYKRVLWQYLKDNHGLNCAYSTFRTYIRKHDSFNNYFKKGRQKSTPVGTTRFETKPGCQA